MKYLQSFSLFESRTSGTLTAEQKEFLDQYTGGTWSVNPATGLVDVQGMFHCSGHRLESLCGIKFGTVTRDFNCDWNKLTTLEGAPQTVTGNFYCHVNQLTSLEGAPQAVGGGFLCFKNKLTSLAGAPETVERNFQCDAFDLGPGQWNLEGWLEVLRTGSLEAQKLISTLPYLQPDWWNSEISSNPVETLFRLAAVWDKMSEQTKMEIKIPSGLQDDFDNFLDLERAGVY
jgi:hypothetical protein